MDLEQQNGLNRNMRQPTRLQVIHANLFFDLKDIYIYIDIDL